MKFGMWDQSKGKDEAFGDVEIKYHRDDGTDDLFQEVIGRAQARNVVVRMGHPDREKLHMLMRDVIRATGVDPVSSFYFAQSKKPVVTIIVKEGVGFFDLVREATRVRDLLTNEWPSDNKLPRRYVNGRLARPDVGKSELER